MATVLPKRVVGEGGNPVATMGAGWMSSPLPQGVSGTPPWPVRRLLVLAEGGSAMAPLEPSRLASKAGTLASVKTS